MKVLSALLAVSFVAVSAYELSSKQFLNNPQDIMTTFRGASGRVMDGINATEDMFPHQVSLLLLRPSSSAWCSGSLISIKWVLTAARCMKEVLWVFVQLGGSTRTSPIVTHAVAKDKIITHELWDESTSMNDIALIEIPLTELSSKIQVIQLPPLSSSSKYAKKEAIISGWCLEGDPKAKVANMLQWSQVKIIKNKACVRSHGKIIVDTNICAQSSDQVSPCSSDAGGPLALTSSGIQVGIISFGPSEERKGEGSSPLVFTRVSKYMDWIIEKTGVLY